MTEFVFKEASEKDLPFLVNTIIEAEKSGTNRLSYSTVFGLSEPETRLYLTKMLMEEIDGCELSFSSFLVATVNNEPAAALSAWIEGIDGIPSSILKGNLLTFILPKECIKKAKSISEVTKLINIEYTPGSIQIGAGYVSMKYRGNNLLGKLTNSIMIKLRHIHPQVNTAFAQIFDCNIPSLRTYEKLGFEVVKTKQTSNKDILRYLPSDKKVLMKKDLTDK